MKIEDQELAISKLLGEEKSYGRYTEDLNRIHQAVRLLFPNQVSAGYYHHLWELYEKNLRVATGGTPTSWNDHDYQLATSGQKCEAILRTFDLWKE